MTGEKVDEAAGRCAEMLLKIYPQLKAERAEETYSFPAKIREDFFLKMGAHLLYVRGQISILLAEGRTEKAMRWLGFLQGALWMTGVPLATLKDMKSAPKISRTCAARCSSASSRFAPGSATRPRISRGCSRRSSR